MVANLADIKSREQEEKPVFVPRKKRRANINDLLPPSSDPAPSSASPLIGSSSKPQEPKEAPRPVIPLWRIEKEAEQRALQDNSASPSPPSSGKWTEKPRSDMTARDWRIMRNDLRIKTSEPIEPLLSWKELSNKQLRNELYRTVPSPTPIQRAAIQSACWGNTDLLAVAPTGSGKTIGFVAPILELGVQKALILAPTRELALQITTVLNAYSLKQVDVVSLVGGHDFEDQAKQLQNCGPRSVIVATPGRLLDFLDQHLIELKHCDYLVFDEADRMIDMGFEPQISAIMSHLQSEKRRTLMFSATWPKEVQELSHKFLKPNHLKIEVSMENSSAPKIAQSVELINTDSQKLERLVKLVKQTKTPVICFVATKRSAESLVSQLNSKQINSMCLHGGLNQSLRDSTIAALRGRKIKCLVATDVASRGVDVPGVSLVVNYDLPSTAELYVHRIGRTGRAGDRGSAVSFATDADSALFPELRRLLRTSGCTVPTFLLENRSNQSN